jgi:predicted dehydrogenase
MHPPSSRTSQLNRRDFLMTGSAAIAATIFSPQLGRGSQANSKLALGVVGCGSRGTWIADLFANHGGFQVVAAADYFPDRAATFGDKFGIDASRRYTGLGGYRKLIESQLDAIAIESPPYFHPQQAADAINAGKHVFLAKPIAVDVPGCRLVAEAARKATERNLVMLVDFQTRADPIYRETAKRVHFGDIGRIISGEAVYYCDTAFAAARFNRDNPEDRLRNWGSDRALSGDIIVEQNIHALDVATWMIDQSPLWAVGGGGRKTRGGCGDINDHFALLYGFPDNVLLSFSSKQIGQGMDDIGCWIFGSRGTAESHYFGSVRIRGDIPYAGGDMKNLYGDGAVGNIAAFHDCVTRGDCSNGTVAQSLRSNLTAILGRSAAHHGGSLSWDDLLKADQVLEADLKGLKA